MSSPADDTLRLRRPHRRTHKSLAGWLAFVAAVTIAVASAAGRMLGKTGDHTEVIGLVSAFLAFSAACFGLRTYETVSDRSMGKQKQ